MCKEINNHEYGKILQSENNSDYPNNQCENTWKKEIKENVLTWLETYEDTPDTTDDCDNIPDLYSFYAELCALRNEQKKGLKRNNDISSQLIDSIEEFENTLSLITTKLDSDSKIDSSKISFFKPLTDIFVRFERLSEKYKKTPQFSFFTPKKHIVAEWKSMDQAFSLVKTHFDNLLSSESVFRITTTNEPFDPHTMTAVALEERDDIPPNTVVKEIKPGFYFKNNVLVLAEVTVSTKKGNE